MAQATPAAHPTVGSRRTLQVTAVIDRGGSSAPVSFDNFAETVLRELLVNEIAVFGNGRLGVDPHDDQAAVLTFDAVSWELVAYHGEPPDPGEVWDRVVLSTRALTGDGWRVVRVTADDWR